MKRIILLGFSIGILCQGVLANPKSDSILAFTGKPTKCVWMRYNWCNASYTPTNPATATMMLLDTKEGAERVLASDFQSPDPNANQGEVRISRSGKYATMCDLTKTWIVDLEGTVPNKRVFLDKSTCAYWAVKAFGTDASGKDVAYCLANFNPDRLKDGSTRAYSGTGMWKVPITSSGNADIANAKEITISWPTSTHYIDGSIGVSADGNKIGGMYPWNTNPGILDATTGKIASRNPADAGGTCHTNLAPDNSNRFFSWDADHYTIYMWDGAGANKWNVNFQNIPGVGVGSNSNPVVFWCARWSNDVQFITCSFPEPDEGKGQWLQYTSSTQIKALKVGDLYHCFIGKFSTDFKSITKGMVLAFDPRFIDYALEMWVNPSTKTVKQNRDMISNKSLKIDHVGSVINLTGIASNSSVKLTNAQGSIVKNTSGIATIETKNLQSGTYFLTVNSHDGNISKSISIVR